MRINIGTIKAVLILLFAILLVLNIAYANVPISSGPVSHNVIAAEKKNAAIVDFLKPYTDFLANTPSNEYRSVTFTAISNQPDETATYCQAGMDYDKNAGTLTGEGDQLFSNRFFGDYNPGHPFDPNQKESIRLTLNTQTGSATLTLLSHGNTQETLDLQVGNNLLYGFTSTSPATMFVISFGKFETAK